MKKYIFSFICLVFVLSVNIYFRLYPVFFPQLKTNAKFITDRKVHQAASEEIEKNFSDYDPLAKNRLLKTYLKNYKKVHRNAIKRQILQEYQKLKDPYQDEEGYTYLMELDCWHWARYVDNVVNLGHPGDKVVGGRQFDLMMLAPVGVFLEWDQFLHYFSAYLYKFFSLFEKVPLFRFLFFLPLLFTVVFLSALYFFSFRFGRHLGAVISCLFVGLAPVFLPRSCAGWFDKDILNLLFPLLAVWTYLLSICAITWKKKIFWLILSSFWVGLFCFTWTHWWFIFLIIVGYEIISLLNLLSAGISYKSEARRLFKQHALSLLVFIIFTVLWVVAMVGTQPLIKFYSQVRQALLLNKPLISSVWPNVYATVQELSKTDYLQIMRLNGGPVLFLSPLVSMLLLIFIYARSNQKLNIFRYEALFILIVWFMVMFFAVTKGMRFVMFLLIPQGLCLGWMINESYVFFRDKKKKWLLAVTFFAAAFISIKCLSNALQTCKFIFPLINDNFYQTLEKLKETSAEDAVINSWWDLGDWYKVIAKRRVIFDGQSQDVPQAYWMANALITNDEKEAIGILRMLNNSGNQAFDTINARLKDPFRSILLLKSIMHKEPDEAREVLLRALPEDAAEKVIKFIFDKPPAAYFIVDYNLTNKLAAISFLGNWDFRKVYLAQHVNNKNKNEILDYLAGLGMDNQQAEKLIKEAALVSNKHLDFWISKRYQFRSALVNGRENNGIVLFDNGFIYIPSKKMFYVYMPKENKYKIPRSLFIFEDNDSKEITLPDSNMDVTALIFKTEKGYRAILADRQLANSIFVRLYFLNGAGLKNFKPFLNKQYDDYNYIRIFEIEWGESGKI